MVFAFCWAGRNREVLSSVLQSMHPKKSRDPASQVPSLWNCIWAERCSICKDMNELIVLLYKVASMCVLESAHSCSLMLWKHNERPFSLSSFQIISYMVFRKPEIAYL